VAQAATVTAPASVAASNGSNVISYFAIIVR
jgi:hypothetical protein